ncbi:hypothetical protein HPB51_015591 [Rhipicephalus microplus]|uniref:Intermembrane lipid transfer protein VPS13-like C-terminal domain-containing protein n=1 Tax=Rhipicephalus microplus TaxID=6941 RepID=A0A9J6DHH3_RHIMP|nr:hypothetical protein HPB51_015591 [Rhipicephalus microplus]
MIPAWFKNIDASLDDLRILEEMQGALILPFLSDVMTTSVIGQLVVNCLCKQLFHTLIRHVFLLEKCQLWGGWTVQWSIRLEDIVSVPFISGTSLVIQVRQDESVASFMGSERFLVCQDEGLLKWLKLKIETVLLFTMEERPCPLDG